MAFSGPIEDRLSIRELYGCYADASSRGDLDAWLACWADECHWNSHGFNCSGKDGVREQWEIFWAGFDSVAFLSEIGAIEVEGDRAAARAIAREIVRLKDGGIYKLAGCYSDQLVRQKGRWLFARRDYDLLVEETPGQGS